MIWIPVYAVYYVVVTPGSIKEVKFYFLLISSSLDIDRSIFLFKNLHNSIIGAFKDRCNFSEYSEGFETEHKVASKITEGGEIGSDTNVGEQRRIDHEEQ